MSLIDISVQAASHAPAAAGYVLAQLPDLGGGQAPPGSGKAVTILKWFLYIVSLVCVAGVIRVGGKMANESRHGGGGEHVQSLGWVLGGCIVVGSATAIAGALL